MEEDACNSSLTSNPISCNHFSRNRQDHLLPGKFSGRWLNRVLANRNSCFSLEFSELAVALKKFII